MVQVRIQVVSMAKKFLKSKKHFITETGQSEILALIKEDICVEMVKINMRNAAYFILINFDM